MDVFWATMWGALAGAVVGAAASWFFALDLRRREREIAYNATLEGHLGRVVEALNDLAVELAARPAQPPGSSKPLWAKPPRAAAEARALAAIQSALFHARGSDAEVVQRLERAVGEMGDGERGAGRAVRVCHALIAWQRRGETGVWAVAAIDGAFDPVWDRSGTP